MSFLCRLRRRRRVVRPRGKLYELTPLKDQVELHRARRVEREFDHHQVRRIVIARSRGTLEHVSVQALCVSLETAHSQEPLRARNHAWNPLSDRIIHSFELRAPLFAPPHKASQTSFTGVRRGNYRRDKVDTGTRDGAKSRSSWVLVRFLCQAVSPILPMNSMTRLLCRGVWRLWQRKPSL